MNDEKDIPKKITNQDIDEMIAGIQANYLLREGLCGFDLTGCDMSELDFDHFKLLCFDENTVFSEEQKKKFGIAQLIDSAKSPMKEIQNLHNMGIDGRGIKIAIIDTNIDVKETKNKYGSNFQYVSSDFSGRIEPHGASVLDSFMQTAPNVELQYYPLDKTKRENKCEHFIEYINQIAKAGVKIISLSNSLKNIITDKDKIEEIREFMENNGITLIDSDLFYRDFTYCFRDIDGTGNETYKECLCEPEDLKYIGQWNKISEAYHQLLIDYDAKNIVELKQKLIEKGDKESLQGITEFEPILNYEEFFAGKGSPLHFLKQREKTKERAERNYKKSIEIPCAGRILNEKYWGTSSASYTIPIVAAMFAMCRQISKNISYEDFVKYCRQTSKKIDGRRVISPQQLMRYVKNYNKEEQLNGLQSIAKDAEPIYMDRVFNEIRNDLNQEIEKGDIVSYE